MKKRVVSFVACFALSAGSARAQTVAPIYFQDLTQSQNNATNLLLPLSQISPTNSTFWNANRNITWSVANGVSSIPFLTPYSSSNPNTLTSTALSIYDAPYTRPNLYQLADGLGSNLGNVYQSLATWKNPEPYNADHATWCH